MNHTLWTQMLERDKSELLSQGPSRAIVAFVSETVLSLHVVQFEFQLHIRDFMEAYARHVHFMFQFEAMNQRKIGLVNF